LDFEDAYQIRFLYLPLKYKTLDWLSKKIDEWLIPVFKQDHQARP
jgi:hypothetical protein